MFRTKEELLKWCRQNIKYCTDDKCIFKKQQGVNCSDIDRVTNMIKDRLINIINTVYEAEGFQGVIEEVEDRLEYGQVKKMNGLVRISTGGWSEDELLLDCLINILCKFHKHYCGYVRGGAFYFCEEPYANVEMMRIYDYEQARNLGLINYD